jgi:glutathione S-transferase
MKLYYHPVSINSRKALLTAALLELPLELHLMDIDRGEHKKPEYLALNPNGMIPTLEDAGFVLWESNAISQYLATARGNSSLYPSDPRVRADISRWQLWDVAHWARPVQTLAFERMYKKLARIGQPDAARVETALHDFRECARVLDAHLSKRTHLVGHEWTLADLSVACGLTFARQAALPVEDCRNLQRWFASIEKLDAWTKTSPRLPVCGRQPGG